MTTDHQHPRMSFWMIILGLQFAASLGIINLSPPKQQLVSQKRLQCVGSITSPASWELWWWSKPSVAWAVKGQSAWLFGWYYPPGDPYEPAVLEDEKPKKTCLQYKTFRSKTFKSSNIQTYFLARGNLSNCLPSFKKITGRMQQLQLHSRKLTWQ